MNSLQNLQMLCNRLREEKEGKKLQMLLSPRRNGLDSLFEEVRVFQEGSWLRRADTQTPTR